MAREVWSDPRAALDKRIRSSPDEDWREQIGVVADLRDDGIDQKAPTIVYWPVLQKNFGAGGVAIRSVVYLIRTPRAGSMGFDGITPGDPAGRSECESTLAGCGRQDVAIGNRRRNYSW